MGPAELILPFGQHPGWEVWRYNAGRGQTWDNLFRMVTVVPLLALAQLRHWPQSVRVFAVAVVPVWMIFVPILAVATRHDCSSSHTFWCSCPGQWWGCARPW